MNVSISSSLNSLDTDFDINALFQQNELNITFRNENNIPEVDITLVDITGKLVFSTKVSNEANWEKSFHVPAPSGQYFLKIDAKESGSTTQKLFKP